MIYILAINGLTVKVLTHKQFLESVEFTQSRKYMAGPNLLILILPRS